MRRVWKLVTGFLLTAGLAFALYLSFPRLATEFGKWQVERECKRAFGAPLSHEGIEFGDRRIVIHRPLVQDEAWELTANSLLIEGEFYPWNRDPFLSLTLESPKLNLFLTPGAPPAKDLIQPSISKTPFRGEWQIIDGDIQIFTEGSKEPVSMHLEAGGQLGEHAGALVNLTLPKEPDGSIRLSYQQDPSGTTVNFGLNSVPAPLLAQLLAGIDGQIDGEWLVDKGQLTGGGAIHITEEDAPYAEGKLVLEGLEFSHPATTLKGVIPLTTIRLEKSEAPVLESTHSLLSRLIQGTQGRLELSGQSSVTAHPQHSSSWALRNLEGSAILRNSDLLLAASAQLAYGQRSCTFEATGNLKVPELSQAELAFSWTPRGESESTSGSKLSLAEMIDGRKRLKLILDNIGEEQAVILHAIASDLFPQYAGAHLSSGRLSAEIDFILSGHTLQELHVEGLSASSLALSLPYWKMKGRLEDAEGYFSAAVTPDRRLGQLSGDLRLIGGELEWIGADGIRESLADVAIDLMVNNGELERAKIKGNLGGLRAMLETNRPDLGGDVRVRVKGPIKELEEKVPPAFREMLKNSFSSDIFNFEATVRAEEPLFLVEGACEIGDGENESSSLPFRLRLKQLDPESGAAPSELGAWLELAIALAEASFSESYQTLVLEEGWVSGHNLNASKFALPFVHRPRPTRLEGRLNFEAHFDKDLLEIQYEGVDVLLECEDFRVEVPKIGNLNPEVAQAERAFHYVNLKTGSESGSIPIQNGTFVDFYTGLTFQDTNCHIALKGDRTEVTRVTTSCEGLVAQGSVMVDDFGDAADITIHATSMEGQANGAKRLLSHIAPENQINVPLEGRVSLLGDGLMLKLHIGQERPNEASIKALFSEGAWTSPDGLRSLEDLTATVEYVHADGNLQISKIRGKAHAFDRDFLIQGSGLRYRDFPVGECEFDLSVFEGKEERARIKGSSKSLEGEVRELVFDSQRTHFDGFNLEIDRCLLKGWHELVAFSARAQIDLKSASRGVTLLSDLGLTPALSKGIERLIGPNASGELFAKIDLKGDESDFLIELSGQRLVIGQRPIGRLHITGKGGKEGLLTVDRISIDGVTGQFALKKEGEKWALPMIRMVNQGVSLSASGSYDPSENTLSGEIHSLEIGLNQAQGWPRVGPLLDRLESSGTIDAHGSFQVDLKQPKPWGFQTAFNGEIALYDIEAAGVALESSSKIQCQLLEDGKLVIGDMQAALSPAVRNQRGPALAASLQSASCHLESGEWQINDFRFSLPHDRLGWVAEAVRAISPKLDPQDLSASSLQALGKLRRQGDISGTLSICSRDGEKSLLLTLDDGVYYVGDHPLPLREAKIASEGGVIHMSARTLFQNHEFWLATAHNPDYPDYREVFVSDRAPTSAGGFPLSILLRKDARGEFSVHRIKGALLGTSIDIARQWGLPQGDMPQFVGTIDLDVKKAQGLLPAKLQNALATANLGGHYRLSGHFLLPRGELHRLNFNGTVTGNHFSLLGYELYSMRANVHLSPETLAVRSLTIRDPAGAIAIDRINAKRLDGVNWEFDIPSIKVTNLQPGLLHAPGETPQAGKPFTITRCELTGLKGNQSGLTSLTGKGFLQFSRQRPAHAQFAIPDELKHRQNLDSGRLTPAQGTVYFSIRDRAFHLEKLQNTVSESKGTYFYLARGQGPSTIGFDGKLNLKMRVKQRNLILKLTEPFTIHVKGPIDKPRWSLKATKVTEEQ